MKAALVYDFDGTLARGNMQEHSFIPALKREVPDFWAHTKRFAEEHDADEVLTYMRLMLQEAEALGQPITRSSLQQHGARVPLFEGVSQWFGHINEFAASLGVELDHYVISSGLQEMIEGCSIFREFRQVYASRYLYDEKGHAIWPAVAINYTTKTQFLFRINKGIDSVWETEAINRWMRRLSARCRSSV